MESIESKNRRIAINTLLLYFRTFIMMLISLYTSRVILEVLGVDDFGIYNVVGGVVGLFFLISGSLINAISRFLTFHLGKDDESMLQKVFATSIIIQICLVCLLIILGETIGLWFLHNELSIPLDRMDAAAIVYQVSIIGACIGLMVVPYNACIISHEKMGIYAYMSILEVVLKLAFVYCLYIVTFDKLIAYSIFLTLLSVLMQIFNMAYCWRKFNECRVGLSFDKSVFKEMSTFAGWNFIGNASSVFNGQGISILMNMFFGVAVNAARGIVWQVEGAVKKIVDNLITAINPQITKSYSQGNIEYVKKLMFVSSKMSFYLFFLMALPICLETDTILKTWLSTVPEDTPVFLRLSLVVLAITLIGNSSYTVMMATGNIKRFQLYYTLTGLLVLPITWFGYRIGAPAWISYAFLAFSYIVLQIIRLKLLEVYIPDVLCLFFEKVILSIFKVAILSVIFSSSIVFILDESVLRLVLVSVISVLTTIVSAWFLGIEGDERSKLINIVKRRKVRSSL